MKTSIFDATFTLPPLVEITQVEKDMTVGAHANRTHWNPLPFDCWLR